MKKDPNAQALCRFSNTKASIILTDILDKLTDRQEAKKVGCHITNALQTAAILDTIEDSTQKRFLSQLAYRHYESSLTQLAAQYKDNKWFSFANNTIKARFRQLYGKGLGGQNVHGVLDPDKAI